MNPTSRELSILRRQVGAFTPPMIETLLRNIEFVITPELSLFVPALGPCDYAVTHGHAHPAWSFVYVLSLEGRFELDGRRLAPPVRDRPWIWALAPGVAHGEERLQGHNSYIAFMIDTPLFARVLAEYGRKANELPRHRMLPEDGELHGFLMAFFREGRQQRPGREGCLHSLALLIAHRMARLLTGMEDGEFFGGGLDVQRLAEWVKGRLEERLDTPQLAARLHMSESSLRRFLKRETGQTPMQFVSRLRLDRARALLGTSGASLTDIARRCGFSSSSHFSSAFGEAFGLAPREYCRRLGGG